MKRPNIILVLTDDQGYGDLECHGNPWIKTPNLNGFYEESLRMTNYHVCAVCAPTRASLMTGHYADSTGVWHTTGGRSLLREDEWSLADALRENGYATGIFGKWHLGEGYPYRPQDRGFMKTVIHGGGGISQTADYWGNDYYDDTYFVNGEPQKFTGYCTDVFFGEARKFIHENKYRPFFCYLATNAPHAPYNVEDRYADPYRGQVMERRARFYGMISNIDENFGKLRRFLQEEGLEDNTILMFMTDNGSSQAQTFDKEGNLLEGYNAGLRGMKGSEYDGGHRVPFFVRYPDGNVGGGVSCNELTSVVDFMPTVLDFCGIAPGGHTFHGVSLKRIMENPQEKLKDRYVITDNQWVVDPIKWKQSAVMRGEIRLINGKELYDVSSDWSQEHDLAAEYPELVRQMREVYEHWWGDVSVKFADPIPMHITKPTELTAQDWRGDAFNCVWSQHLVRSGRRTQGHWEVLAEESGIYQVDAFRWAPETGYAIGRGIAGNDSGYDRKFAEQLFWKCYEGGEAIAVREAAAYLDGICVQRQEQVNTELPSVRFTLHVGKGNHNLEIRFTEENGTVFGAYYVKIQCLCAEKSEEISDGCPLSR